MLLVTATKNDDVTAADILVIWQGGPENFRWIFEVLGVDCVISIGRHTEQEQAPDRRIKSVPLRYYGDIPVYTTAIDKTGITATKLLNKVRRSIISVVEGSAEGIRATIVVRQDRGTEQIMGGYDPLWSDGFTCLFRPLQGEG